MSRPEDLAAARAALEAEIAAEEPSTRSAAIGAAAVLHDEARTSSAHARLVPVVRAFAEIESKLLEWLWPGYLPVGKLVVLEGDPGLGKSTLTAAIAAAVSGGPQLPGAPRLDPRVVLMVSYEDDPGDTIRPRLEAAGADLRLVSTLTLHEEDGDHSLDGMPLSFPGNLAQLEQAVAEKAARLVVIDPLGAALSSAVDTYKDANVRGALAPIAAMAARQACCVMLVRHLTKRSGGKAIAAGGGSIGIAGAARVVLLLAVDPADEGRRVLAVTKCNVAAKPDSLSLALDATSGGAARITWHGIARVSADELVAAREGGDAEDGGDLDGWLRDALAGGPRPRAELVQAMAADGFGSGEAAERRLRRAAGRIGAKMERVRGFGGGSVYRLTAVRDNPDVEDMHARTSGTSGMGSGVRNGEAETVPRVQEW